jgi:2-oxoglutarate dehydrogenase complex dehydrogenase (E1) component-like enzyme
MGVKFVMGMAHRGRLNILANIFGKSTQDIFGEFEGKDYDKEYFDGDVVSLRPLIRQQEQEKININLAPNPSHLETVGAVIEELQELNKTSISLMIFQKYSLLQFTVMPLLQDKNTV